MAERYFYELHPSELPLDEREERSPLEDGPRLSYLPEVFRRLRQLEND